jgi:hypothetical protein
LNDDHTDDLLLRPVRGPGPSGWIGVRREYGKWVARAKIGGRFVQVGRFETAEAAAIARARFLAEEMSKAD